MIDFAKAFDILIFSVVTPLVTQSEQAFHHAITELELIAGGLGSGKWTDGLQKTSVWPDLVSVQATSSKAVDDTTISDKLATLTNAQDCLLDSFGLVPAEAQMARASDVVAMGQTQAFQPNDPSTKTYFHKNTERKLEGTVSPKPWCTTKGFCVVEKR